MKAKELQALKDSGKIRGWGPEARKAAGDIKPRKKPGKEESDIQAGMVNAFAVMFPKYYPFLFAIPNGGLRSKTTAKRLKAEGVKRGVWDLQLTYPVGRWAGAFFETKTATGQLTEEQKEFRDLHENTHFFRVCRSTAEFIAAFKEYLSQA